MSAPSALWETSNKKEHNIITIIIICYSYLFVSVLERLTGGVVIKIKIIIIIMMMMMMMIIMMMMMYEINSKIQRCIDKNGLLPKLVYIIIL